MIEFLTGILKTQTQTHQSYTKLTPHSYAVIMKQIKPPNTFLSRFPQAKHSQEGLLLEDVHAYMKKRAAIEKTYGEALLKLTTQFQAHCGPSFELGAFYQGNPPWVTHYTS